MTHVSWLARAGLLAATILALAFAVPAIASASTLSLSSVPNSNMAPVCPGGYLVSMQNGDATPPATPPSCGLSTMGTTASSVTGVFSSPAAGGSVVVSAYINTGSRVTTLTLLVNGQPLGSPITATANTRQWWSFPSVDVLASDALQVKVSLGTGSMSTVSSLHAEFTPHATTDLGSLIHSEMNTPHDLLPEGVPSFWNWYANPVVTDAADGRGYKYGNPWGQIYIASNGNSQLGPNGETMWVDYENLNAWVLRTSTNTWTPLYGDTATPPNYFVPTLGGALYPEDFSSGSMGGNFNRVSAHEVKVAPKCATCAPATAKGYLFHLYPDQSRVWVWSPDVAAVCSSAEVRLDPSDPITDYQPGLIANVGFDWWSATSGGTANGAGESRFKTVGRSWRELAFCTTTASQQATAPLPPITADPSELF